MKLETYLTFGGNCEEAMNFYKDVLGGDFTMMMRFDEMPPDVFPVPENKKDLIMHCTLVTDKGCTLMASDTLELDKLTIGSNYSISIGTPDENEGASMYENLSAGGHTIMPYENAFWGGKFGMFVDKFGIQWMVSGGGEKPE